MDPTLVLAITSISAIGVGILGKVMYTLRHNVKSCWGIVFRSTPTSRNSPRLQELNIIRDHLGSTLPSTHITPVMKTNENVVKELEKQILELQQENLNLGSILTNKLRETQNNDSDLVFI